MGGLLGQASLGRPMGMRQMHAVPVMRMAPIRMSPFGGSPFGSLHHDDLEDPFHDDFEDPMDVIRRMEQGMRPSPLFGGPRRQPPMMNTLPDIVED
jgi:hypothetical protein